MFKPLFFFNNNVLRSIKQTIAVLPLRNYLIVTFS